MINKLSLRVSLAAGIVFMGVLGVLLAWYVDDTYRRIAVDNQRLSIEEILRLRVDDLFSELVETSRDLGQSVQNSASFRENLKNHNVSNLVSHLDQQFHQYFVTAGIVKLTALVAHDVDLHLVASVVSEEAKDHGLGVSACPSLHLKAVERGGSNRYKTISQLCLNQGFPSMHVLIPIGGLRLVGYLEVITDPVYTLSSIEKNLGMPVRILYMDGSTAYVSENWPNDNHNRKGIIATFNPKTSTDNESLQIEVLRDVHDYEVLLNNTRAGLMVTVGLVTLVFAALMLFFIKKSTLDPLRYIVDYLKEIKLNSANLGRQVIVNGNEEIRELASGFNEMTRELKSLYDELQEINVDLSTQVKEREKAQIQLKISRDHLEELVEKRTADLAVARDTALRASQSKSQFLANMSHELRTPLNAIIGYSELLLEDAEEIGDAYTSDLEKIHSSARHLLSLIRDILDISKIEAGKVDLDLKPFDVFEMVSDLSAAIQPMMLQNNNQFSIDCDQDVGLVTADMIKLRQALLNLLSNGAKFTRDGKVNLRVTRFLEKNSEKILYTVSDSGIGLSKSEMDKIFEAFTQADTSTTREYGGTGLGLAISRNFCQIMGGDLYVTSIKGEGSTFSILLPVEVKPIGEPVSLGGSTLMEPYIQRFTRSSDPNNFERRSYISSVLFLLGNRKAAQELSQFLKFKAYETAIANDVDHYFSLLSSQHFDVIVVDVDIAVRCDWTLMSEGLKLEGMAGSSIILIGDPADAERGMALGAADCIIKPVEKTLLQAVINSCLRKQRAQLVREKSFK